MPSSAPPANFNSGAQGPRPSPRRPRPPCLRRGTRTPLLQLPLPLPRLRLEGGTGTSRCTSLLLRAPGPASLGTGPRPRERRAPSPALLQPPAPSVACQRCSGAARGAGLERAARLRNHVVRGGGGLRSPPPAGLRRTRSAEAPPPPAPGLFRPAPPGLFQRLDFGESARPGPARPPPASRSGRFPPPPPGLMHRARGWRWKC